MLEINNISHTYSNNKVLESVSFNVKPASLCCITGPSGCGKTTLLRIIAGLTALQSGYVKLNNQTLANSDFNCPPEKRKIGMVFQNPSLFPHLNVFHNISFGLHGIPKDIIQNKVDYLLKLIGLEGLRDRYPHQLSGGQQQRVSIARALAPEPNLMLLDEPFANLDQSLRREIREELLLILKEAMIPILMVTHDPEEVLLIADSMVLLSNCGKLIQTGSPRQVRNHPSNLVAASFFGPLNVLRASVNGENASSAIGKFPLKIFSKTTNTSNNLLVIRPEGIRPAFNNEKNITAQVLSVHRSEIGYLINCKLNDGSKIKYFHIYGPPPKNNDFVNLVIDTKHIFLF